MVIARDEKNFSTLLVDTEFRNWCQCIQVAECLSYLVAVSQFNNLSPPVSGRMKSLLATCLVKCSVSNMRYIIWKAVESATISVQQPNITFKRASNFIYDNISQIFGKVSIGNWQTDKCYRGSRHPQSAMAKIFFDYVFKVEDSGFDYRLDELINRGQFQLNLDQTIYLTLGSMKSAKYKIKIESLK